MKTENKKAECKPGTPEIKELLAFQLYRLSEPGTDVPVLENTWRKNEDVRVDYRDQAACLLLGLEVQGIRLAGSDTKQIKRSIDHLLTIPAAKAYAL